MNPLSVSPLNSALLIARMEQAASPSRLRELTAALARGEDEAWAEFHREYGPGIFRYLLGGTRGDYDLAAEALQQTYLRVARYVRPCDSAPVFGGWLRTLASSALNDCRRRRRSFWGLLSRPEAAPDDPAASPAADDGLVAALDTALAQLDAADRALLEDKYFRGTDVRTLAAKLSASPKAIESRLTRAREELRRQLTLILARHE